MYVFTVVDFYTIKCIALLVSQKGIKCAIFVFVFTNKRYRGKSILLHIYILESLGTVELWSVIQSTAGPAILNDSAQRWFYY